MRRHADKYGDRIKGLKRVHIGQNVWRIGRVTKVDGKLHQVLYGPDDKEYHLDNSVIHRLTGCVNNDGNYTDQSKLKVYILTEVLDEKKNWCFTMNKKPSIGKLKIIYDNGTVKNVDFDGNWESIEIGYKQVYPVGYRLI